ncbi:MAG: DegV family protein [Aggregatilineales bacterium]|nr:DegV family protein [Aggregatilineales bacterium]HPV08263.1 DegV family protein [Aggregatilineales bacterium]
MIKIITDTTAGLPPEELEKYGIPMVPQYVHFGDEAVRDVFDIGTEEFYRRQAAASELPKTSAPSVGDFLVVFEEILSEHPDATVLCIHPSAEVSGTIRSARPAAAQIKEKYPQADIRIFDTRSVSLGLGLAVLEAARMVEQGATADDVLKRLAFMRDNMQVYFVVGTLEYLAKGGRIGRASHLVGSLLDIKPILTLVDGTVESYAKARTRKRAIAMLRDMALEGAKGKPGVRLGVAHALCEDEARELADLLCAELSPEVFLFSDVGPSIGVHAGPHTLAVGWVSVPDGE